MLELARPDDREAIEILAQQIHGQRVTWRPDLFAPVPELYPQDRFRDAVKQRQLYVARIGDVVAGYALLRIRENTCPGIICHKVMVIDEICVEELCRGQGIGTSIMEDIHALSKAFRCGDLELNVYPQNDDAVGFFQKCGFTIRSIDMHRKV